MSIVVGIYMKARWTNGFVKAVKGFVVCHTDVAVGNLSSCGPEELTSSFKILENSYQSTADGDSRGRPGTLCCTY